MCNETITTIGYLLLGFMLYDGAKFVFIETRDRVMFSALERRYPREFAEIAAEVRKDVIE
jgi:hypothetical protein